MNTSPAASQLSRWALTGDILTMDSSRPSARVVVVENDRIVGVGGDELLREVREANVSVTDVGARCVLPGFVDPHAHAEIAARALTEMVDCRVPRHKCIPEILETLSENIWRAEESGWLVGQANLFLDQKLAEKRLPTREELDSVSKDIAIVLRAGGHTSVLNTKGFEVSNVSRFAGKTGMMGDAVIERDRGGQPTGVISELDKALPLPEPSEDELRRELRDGIRDLFTRFGVTSIGEISESLSGLRMMDDLLRREELSTRLSVLLWAPGTMPLEAAIEWQNHITFHSDARWMEVRGVKMFSDGGYSARNAATRTPYLPQHAVEPGSRGQLSLGRDRIADVVKRTRANGLQLAVHANGERAQDEVCAGVVAAGVVDDPRLQTRVEHAGNLVTDDVTVDAWAEAGILPMPQPVFLYNFGDFFPVYLGDPGLVGRFPFRALVEKGWKLSGSSDVLLGSEERQTNPLFSVWCCVKRETFFGEIIDPEQRLTVDEALKMHTVHAAFALGKGHERGSIQVGKLADMIVLAENPHSVAVDSIPDIAVEQVFVGGQSVYERLTRSDEAGHPSDDR